MPTMISLPPLTCSIRAKPIIWPELCLTCGRRSLHSSRTSRAANSAPPLARPKATSTSTSIPSSAKKPDDFTPQPLTRSVGMPHAPRTGENSGVDVRPWRQRRDDLLNYDKHLERRKQLTAAVAKPYFREWSDMRHHKGKSFLAPTRLFRADRALFFPNLRGRTLVKEAAARKSAAMRTRREAGAASTTEDPIAATAGGEETDTTTVLEGKVSVVSIFSGTWAERQAASFFGPCSSLPSAASSSPMTAEPATTTCASTAAPHSLEHYMRHSMGDVAQKVEINIEENAIKAWLVRLFMPSLRRARPIHQHALYFLVRRGLDDGIRTALGLANSKVGYVYLLDAQCRIRWAGSGRAEEVERQALARGLRRLCEEERERKKTEKEEFKRR